MSLADKIAREMEIKMDLMIEGINIEEAALEGVGTKYCEKIIFLFDYTRYGLKGGTIIPSEMMLLEEGAGVCRGGIWERQRHQRAGRRAGAQGELL